MFDKKIKNVADAVMSVIGVQEEIDPKVRTKDTTKGREKTAQTDDVGPGSDGKSTKVKYHPGPLVTSENFKERLVNHLQESDEEMLSRYMKSRGYNPETTPKDKKIAITKSNEFKKWLNDHQFEESDYEEYSDEQLDEMINEVLGKDATAGDWIHDFVHSDNPKFKGKSKEKRKKMALAAYYAHQREEISYEEFEKAVLEEIELEEGKQPESDTVPFVEPYQKSQPDVPAKGTSGTHTPMSRARHLARMSLKKVKNEMLGKAGTTSEEVEQIDEISSKLASRYLAKKHDRDYEQTGPNTSRRKEPQTMSQAMKDGRNTVRALKRIGPLSKIGTKAK